MSALDILVDVPPPDREGSDVIKTDAHRVGTAQFRINRLVANSTDPTIPIKNGQVINDLAVFLHALTPELAIPRVWWLVLITPLTWHGASGGDLDSTRLAIRDGESFSVTVQPALIRAELGIAFSLEYKTALCAAYVDRPSTLLTWRVAIIVEPIGHPTRPRTELRLWAALGACREQITAFDAGLCRRLASLLIGGVARLRAVGRWATTLSWWGFYPGEGGLATTAFDLVDYCELRKVLRRNGIGTLLMSEMCCGTGLFWENPGPLSENVVR